MLPKLVEGQPPVFLLPKWKLEGIVDDLIVYKFCRREIHVGR